MTRTTKGVQAKLRSQELTQNDTSLSSQQPLFMAAQPYSPLPFPLRYVPEQEEQEEEKLGPYIDESQLEVDNSPKVSPQTQTQTQRRTNTHSHSHLHNAARKSIPSARTGSELPDSCSDVVNSAIRPPSISPANVIVNHSMSVFSFARATLDSPAGNRESFFRRDDLISSNTDGDQESLEFSRTRGMPLKKNRDGNRLNDDEFQECPADRMTALLARLKVAAQNLTDAEHDYQEEFG